MEICSNSVYQNGTNSYGTQIAIGRTASSAYGVEMYGIVEGNICGAADAGIGKISISRPSGSNAQPQYIKGVETRRLVRVVNPTPPGDDYVFWDNASPWISSDWDGGQSDTHTSGHTHANFKTLGNYARLAIGTSHPTT